MQNIRFPRANATDTVVIKGQVWNDLVSAVERSDRLNVAPPLYLANDGAAGKTIAVVLVPGNTVQVQLGAPAGGFGKYTGTIWNPPTTDVSATSDLTSSQIGTNGIAALICNQLECGQSTNGLVIASGIVPTIFTGTIVRVNSDGTPVVAIYGLQWKTCP